MPLTFGELDHATDIWWTGTWHWHLVSWNMPLTFGELEHATNIWPAGTSHCHLASWNMPLPFGELQLATDMWWASTCHWHLVSCNLPLTSGELEHATDIWWACKDNQVWNKLMIQTCSCQTAGGTCRDAESPQNMAIKCVFLMILNWFIELSCTFYFWLMF